MNWIASFLLAATVSLPALLPFVARRRILVALAVWPFAATLAIALPVHLDPLVGWPRRAWVGEASLCAALLGMLAEIAIRLAPGRSERGSALRPAARWQRSDWFALVIALMLLAALGMSLVVQARTQPYWGWDAYGIWLVKGKIVAGTERLPLALLAGDDLKYMHADYPLAFPAGVAWFVRVGRMDFQTVRGALGLWFAACGLGFWFAARAVSGALGASVSLLAVLGVAGLAPHLAHGYADPWYLMAGVAGMTLALGAARCRDAASLAAAGLALAASALTKNEGIAVAAVVTGASFVMLLVQERSWLSSLRGTAAVAVGWVLFVGLWWLVCARAGIHGDLELGTAGARLPAGLERANRVWEAMEPYVRSRAALLALVAFVASLALAARRGLAKVLSAAAWVLPAFASLAIVFFIYLVTPHDVGWHLGTSLDRTIRFPLLAFVVGAILSLASQDSERNEEARSSSSSSECG